MAKEEMESCDLIVHKLLPEMKEPHTYIISEEAAGLLEKLAGVDPDITITAISDKAQETFDAGCIIPVGCNLVQVRGPNPAAIKAFTFKLNQAAVESEVSLDPQLPFFERLKNLVPRMPEKAKKPDFML